MKQWKWFLLIFELALFAVILILPQVDLPDFAFHGGTAPISAKARASVRPTVTPVIAAANGWLPAHVLETRLEAVRSLASIGSGGRLSLLCTLIC